jgi:hypothetical protein
MTFTRVGIIVVITAVAVYLGLNFLLPRNKAEQKEASATTADQVFSSNTASTPTPPADASQAAAQPAATTPTDSANANAQPAANTTTEAAAGGSSSSSAPAQGLSEDEARKIAEEVGRKTATEVASSVVNNSQQSQPAAAPADNSAAASTPPPAESAPAQPAAAPAESAPAQPAAAEPAPAAESAPAAEPAPAESAAAPAEEAPAPKKSKPAKAKKEHAAPAETASSAPAEGSHAKSAAKPGKGEPSTDVVSAWWPAVAKQDGSKLNLSYAGEAAFEKAVVLLFSDNVDASTGSHIQLLTRDGAAASGHWEVGQQNQRMLVFRTRPGRYTVILAPDVSGSGKTLGTALHGPVYVH